MKSRRRRRQPDAGSSRQGTDDSDEEEPPRRRGRRQLAAGSSRQGTDDSDLEKIQLLRGKQVESDGDATDESDIDRTPFTEEQAQEFLRRITMTPEEITIVFVEALERAHQFFEFKDFLDKCNFIKPDSKRKDIFLKLVKMSDRKSRFNKLDEQTIMDSVDARIEDLENEKMCMLYSKIPPSHISVFEQENKKIRRMFENLGLESQKSAFPDPVLELVHQARKGKYMHLNPVVEHDKIKKSHSAFYEESFLFYKSRPEIHYSETTVTVYPFSIDCTDAKLEELLSVCGEVQTLKRTRSVGRSKVPVAHVTFKDSEAAKIAPFVMRRKWMIVERIPESRRCKSVLKGDEDISSMHKRALDEYKNIRSIYTDRLKKA